VEEADHRSSFSPTSTKSSCSTPRGSRSPPSSQHRIRTCTACSGSRSRESIPCAILYPLSHTWIRPSSFSSRSLTSCSYARGIFVTWASGCRCLRSTSWASSLSQSAWGSWNEAKMSMGSWGRFGITSIGHPP